MNFVSILLLFRRRDTEKEAIRAAPGNQLTSRGRHFEVVSIARHIIVCRRWRCRSGRTRCHYPCAIRLKTRFCADEKWLWRTSLAGILTNQDQQPTDANIKYARSEQQTNSASYVFGFCAPLSWQAQRTTTDLFPARYGRCGTTGEFRHTAMSSGGSRDVSIHRFHDTCPVGSMAGSSKSRGSQNVLKMKWTSRSSCGISKLRAILCELLPQSG